MKYRNKILCVIFLISGITACRQNTGHDLQRYFEEQVQARMQALAEYLPGDTAYFTKVHRRLNDIVFVTKDVENKTTAVKMTSDIFDEICSRYDLDRGDYRDLSLTMNKDEMEMELRENELAFFNHLLMRVQEPTEQGMFTAH